MDKQNEYKYTAVSYTHRAENNLQRITESARQRIRQEGYNYQFTARVVREYCSTRVYENVTLPAGDYNALKIEIGAGAGHNLSLIHI